MSQAVARRVSTLDKQESIVILFPGAGRKQRLDDIKTGRSPKEFFYGTFDLAARGATIHYADTRQDPDGIFAKVCLLAERARNWLTGFGLSKQRVVALRSEIETADVAIGFTDAFSLSLGRYRDVLRGHAVLIGGFHGLSDMLDEIAPLYRPWVRSEIRRAVAGLDHMFFLGEADRKEAIRLFGIPPEKTSLFNFGVDTDFWSPLDDGSCERTDDCVLSVGSDPKRDYATLLAADISLPVRIVTRLKVEVPADRANVEVIPGGYHNVATDGALRDLYRKAAILVVPIRDVFQPSGQSVTLQAMACGKPVILSRIKGLWDPEVFKSGENCLLVEPENPDALADAVALLQENVPLRTKIGEAARATALRSFALQRMNDSLAALIARCRVRKG